MVVARVAEAPSCVDVVDLGCHLTRTNVPASPPRTVADGASHAESSWL